MTRKVPLPWLLTAIIAILPAAASSVWASSPSDQLVQMVRSIDGLTEAEIQQFSKALLDSFAAEVAEGKPLSTESIDTVKSVVETGRFNEMAPEPVASSAHKVYKARQMGAPEAELIDLVEVLFVQPDIGLNELVAASKALNLFRLSAVPEEIYTEVVYHAMERYWKPVELEQVAKGLIYAVRNGLTPRRIALAMIIRVDQGLGNVPASKMVEEEIDYVRSLEPHRWRGGDRGKGLTLSAWEVAEKKRQEAAYQGMDKALAAEVPEQVAQELAYIAIERNWSVPEIQSVFQGMIRGQAIGLTPEKLALSMIIRVDQGLKDVPPLAMVDQEIAFVSRIEADRLAAIEKARAEAEARRERELREARRLKEEAERKAEEEGRLKLELERLRLEQEKKKKEAELQKLEEEKKRREAEQLRIQQELEAERQRKLLEARLREEAAEKKAREELERQREAERRRVEEERRVREEERKRLEEEQRKKEEQRIQAERAAEQQEKKIREQIERVRVEKEKAAVEAETVRNKAMQGVEPRPFAAKRGNTVGAASADLMIDSIRSFINPPPSTPYRWGGTSRKGVDCSGFTQIVYKEQQINIPRVSRDQATVGKPVDTKDLKFGDLVFFNKTGKGRITHVGMYYGNGKFVHSSCSKGVNISRFFHNTYFWKRYVGARRITKVE